jgi:hypothetical protein
MERAEAEMDDTDGLPRAVVIEARDISWQPIERLGRQSHNL